MAMMTLERLIYYFTYDTVNTQGIWYSILKKWYNINAYWPAAGCNDGKIGTCAREQYNISAYY